MTIMSGDRRVFVTKFIDPTLLGLFRMWVMVIRILVTVGLLSAHKGPSLVMSSGYETCLLDVWVQWPH